MDTELKESDLNQRSLDQFTGTENYYKHMLSGYTYTDGIKYLAEKGKSYWLIDKILILTRYTKKLQEFGVWELVVSEDKTAVLTCEDGNGHKLYTETIDYTDFKLDKVEVWFESGVLILPSEH